MYGPGGGGGFAGGGGAPRPFQQRGGGGGGIQRAALSDLPPNLTAMFAPRGMLQFRKPVEERKLPPYTGIAQYTNLFETVPPPPPQPVETPLQRKIHMKEKLQATNAEKNELLAGNWDPHNNPKATENAYLTLFVGRLSFDTTEKKLRREFEQFGPICSIRMVSDLEGGARGYAFVEFEKEEDMTQAVKRWDGRKIDGRRVLLDVERGRTVRNWKPMRFGGGLGGRKAVKSRKVLEEEAALAAKELGAVRSSQIYGPANGGRPVDRGGDRGPPRGNDRDSGRRERSRSRDRAPRGGDSNRGNSRDRGGGGGSGFSTYGGGAAAGGGGGGGGGSGGYRPIDRGDHYGGARGGDSRRDAPPSRGGDRDGGRDRDNGRDSGRDGGRDSGRGGDRDAPRGREGLGLKRERSRERR